MRAHRNVPSWKPYGINQGRKENSRRSIPLRGSGFGGTAPTLTACAGNVRLDDDIGRYSLFRKPTLFSELAVAQACGKEDFLLSTGSDPVCLVRPEVVEQGTGDASPGTSLNTCRYRSPIGDGSPPFWTWSGPGMHRTGRSHPICKSLSFNSWGTWLQSGGKPPRVSRLVAEHQKEEYP